MERFMLALNVMIEAMMQLSQEWERIDPAHSNELAKQYPFDSDFVELTNRVIQWREQINGGDTREW